MSAPLSSLRTEIDEIDDALLGLLLRRGAVVDRLANSRAKGNAPSLRPGREAQVLRRLLAGHEGPFPAAALVRLWRDIFAASTAMQGPFTAAVPARDPVVEALAREHFGLLTPLHPAEDAAHALAMVAEGEASVAVLPMPREAAPAEAGWWTRLDAPRLQVGACLPFWSEGVPPAEALVVIPGAPDPSGEDHSLLRLEAAGKGRLERAALSAAFATLGLPLRRLLLAPGSGDAGGLALAELDGAVLAGDPRLAALPGIDRALPLGLHAVPLRGKPR